MEKLLKSRGPDRSKTIYNGFLFHGTVLWQQGDVVCEQPVVSDDENIVLLFNGDLYMNCLENDVRSDTEFLFELISNAHTESEFLEIFKIITGPFSIICQFKSKIFFARDSLGRNSLLLGKNNGAIFLSSVLDSAACAIEAIELPPLGIYSIDITTKEVDLHPYQKIELHQHYLDQLELVQRMFPVRIHKPINPDWLLRTSSESQAKYSFEELIPDLIDDTTQLFDHLLQNPEIAEICQKFINLLKSSVKQRVYRTQKLCKDCIKIKNPSQCLHSHIGILFSGGVDCSILAILADSFIDPSQPIDLMNVAFEKVSYNGKIVDINWNVPDRITGLETVAELKKLCPYRKWNFIEINVKRTELDENIRRLSSLVFPLSNVLDESLGAALYFASRGCGSVDGKPYASPSRVILIGSGADELFGGYTRHRNAFKRSTPERDLLREELELDWVRLPSRNLARDDRVISDHGITVRAPFIEENFVNFVQSLKPLQRCFPALSEGVGDKLLLRLCAFILGLQKCCRLRKRALQFGSRIADKRQSARDTSKFLLNGAN